MKLHRLETEQWLPLGIQEAWDFFSMPENLDRITPPDMSFEILTGAGERTFAGQIISYKIRPLLNIPMRWVTEITQSENGKYFVDEQRFGPYKFWHHLHEFEKTENGTLIKDKVNYSLPFGLFGNIAHSIYVKKKLAEIFGYRKRILTEKFG